MHLGAEPVQCGRFHRKCDLGGTRQGGENRPAPSLRKIVLVLHSCASYARRSLCVAVRADIRRIWSPRHVYTTTSRRPNESMPVVIQRSSSREAGSWIVMAESSLRTPRASVKSTPCLLRFDSAFGRIPLETHRLYYSLRKPTPVPMDQIRCQECLWCKRV